MIKFTAGVITTLLLIALIGGGYFFLQKPSPVTKPIPITTTQSPTPSTFMPEDKNATASSDSFEKPATTGFVNPRATIDAIETALRNKMYGALASYMSTSVTLTIAGSGSATGKTNVVQKLNILSKAEKPWDLNSTNPIAAQLIVANPTRFKGAFIGTTRDYYAVAFTLNEMYLIDKIYVTPDYRPMLQ